MKVRTIKTSPSEKLATEISKWVKEVKARFPAALSPDRTGVMIYGDLGGAAYISADGTIALEPFVCDPGNPWSLSEYSRRSLSASGCILVRKGACPRRPK